MTLPTRGPLAALAVMAGGLLPLWAAGRRRRGDAPGPAGWLRAVTQPPPKAWLAAVIALGAAARIGWYLLTPGGLRGDDLIYWHLAVGLLDGRYEVDGTRAWYPPGLPFALLPLLAAFGPERWAVLVLNAALAAAGTIGLYRLARLVAGEGPARLAALLFMLWPNLVAAAALPKKELVLAALLPWLLLAYATALARPAAHRPAAAAGLLCGAAALTASSMLAFPLVFAAWEFLFGRPWRAAARRLAIAGLAAAMVVAPWTLRNLAVLNALVPITTAAGQVLFVANNPAANGAWIPDALYFPDAARYPEVDRGRIARDRALCWIRTNPGRFLLLSLRRQAHFLCCADDAALASLSLPREPAAAGPALAVRALFDGSWLLTITAAFAALGPVWRRLPPVRRRRLVAALLPILYLLAIHAVFEAGGRHNIPLYPLWSLAAALAVAGPEATERRRCPRGRAGGAAATCRCRATPDGRR